MDFDATTADRFPLYKALGNAVPDCQVVLLCTRQQAPSAAKVVRVWEAFDYLLTDCELDPSRVLILLERAQTDRLPTLSEMRGFAKRQHRRILELLGEIKETLRADADNPVVRTIRDFRCDSRVVESQNAPFEPGLADAYKSCLVDIICGKLRRLEGEIRSLESREVCTEHDTSGGVLIVEDDVVSAEMAKGLLEGSGFAVVVARTADAAKHALVRHRPAVVIMDIHLGNADGLHLVKLMRQSNDFRQVPVIVVTADRLRSTLSEAAALQVQGYLLKPYQPRELIGKVSNAIQTLRGDEIAQRLRAKSHPETKKRSGRSGPRRAGRQKVAAV